MSELNRTSEPELYNIHRILNKFEEYFPHRRLKTKIDMVSHDCIFVKATYARDVVINKTNTDPKWNDSYDREKIEKYGSYTASCSIMMRIWIHRPENNTPAIYMPKPWKLTLFKDSIYINPFVMPDYIMAQEFFSARNKMTSCFADFIVGSWNIKLSTRQVIQAREKLNHSMEYQIKEFVKYTDMTHSYSEHLNKLRENILEMQSMLTMTEFLYLGPYGCGNKKNNSQYKPPYGKENSDFNIYNKA